MRPPEKENDVQDANDELASLLNTFVLCYWLMFVGGLTMLVIGINCMICTGCSRACSNNDTNAAVLVSFGCLFTIPLLGYYIKLALQPGQSLGEYREANPLSIHRSI